MKHQTPLLVSVMLKLEAGTEPRVWKTGAAGDATLKISNTATMQDVYTAIEGYAASDLSVQTQLPGIDNSVQTTTATSENTAKVESISFEGQNVPKNFDTVTQHLKDGEPFQVKGTMEITLHTSRTKKQCCVIL